MQVQNKKDLGLSESPYRFRYTCYSYSRYTGYTYRRYSFTTSGFKQ